MKPAPKALRDDPGAPPALQSERRRPTGQHTFVAARLPHWGHVTWPEVLFALGVIAAPLALGAVHAVTRVALAGLFVVAFAGAVWRLARERRELRIGWIGGALFVALAWSFLQWLPLPSALVELLSPYAYTTRVAAAELAGLDVPGWMPLALDAGRAALGVLTLLTVTLAFLTATSLRADSDARARITTYIELAALGVLISALIHHGLDLDAIWGVYTPQSGLPSFVTSFVNPNHAAALMLLGALVAFGASLSPERSQRWHLVVGVLLASGVLASLSRANALLLVVALIVLTVPPLFRRRFRDDRARLVRLLAGALSCLFVALVLIGPERWLGELAALGDAGLTDQGVFSQCWTVAADALGLAPLPGLGGGGFAVASPSLSQSVGDAYLAFAHNGVLQVLLDLGVVVGAVVLLMLAFGFGKVARFGLRDARHLPIWGAAVGLGSLALQNLVDFSLWLPGVALPAAATLGLVVEASWPATRVRRRARVSTASEPSPVAQPIALVIAAVGIAIVTAVPALRDAPETWRAAATTALAERAGEHATSEIARIDRQELVTSHPHDHLAFALSAALAERAGEHDEADRFLSRALALAPHDAGTLQAAARQAIRNGDEAAALRVIARLDPDGQGDQRAVDLVLGAPHLKSLHEGFFSAHPARAITAARRLVASDAPERADRLLVWALTRAPDDLELTRELGARRWHDAPFLERLATTCLAHAGSAADPASRARWEQLGYHFQARVEALTRRPLNAYQLYLAAAAAVPDEAVPALLEAGKVANQLGRQDWLEDVLAALAPHAEADRIRGAWPRGEYHLLRSHAAERRGELTLAIREMQAALRTLAHVPAMHARLADLHQRDGDAEAATRARARAEALSLPADGD